MVLYNKRNSTLKKTNLKRDYFCYLVIGECRKAPGQMLSILSQAIYHLPFGMLL